MLKKLLPSLMLLVPLHFAAAAVTYNYFIPGNGLKDAQATLGQGYSSDLDNLVTNCTNPGKVEYTGASVGTLSAAKHANYYQTTHLHGESTDIGFFKVNASLPSLSIVAQNGNLSESYVYRQAFYSKAATFVPSNGNPLTPEAQGLLNTPQQFRDTCGDKYVAQVRFGGYLYFSVKLHFDNAFDLNRFNQLHGDAYASLTNLKSVMDSNLSNQVGSVSIAAVQVGGDSTQLAKILGTDPGAKTATVKTCQFKNLEACDALITSLVGYANGDAATDFPQQFQSTKAQPIPTNAAIIEETYLTYDHLGFNVKSQSELTPEISNARKTLEDYYKLSLSQQTQLNQILASQVIGADYKAKIQAALPVLAQDLTNLNTALNVCHSSLSGCVAASQNAISSYQAIDASLVFGGGWVEPVSNVTMNLPASCLGTDSEATGTVSVQLPSGWSTANIYDLKNYRLLDSQNHLIKAAAHLSADPEFAIKGSAQNGSLTIQMHAPSLCNAMKANGQNSFQLSGQLVLRKV